LSFNRKVRRLVQRKPAQFVVAAAAPVASPQERRNRRGKQNDPQRKGDQITRPGATTGARRERMDIEAGEPVCGDARANSGKALKRVADAGHRSGVESPDFEAAIRKLPYSSDDRGRRPAGVGDDGSFNDDAEGADITEHRHGKREKAEECEEVESAAAGHRPDILSIGHQRHEIN
jgi:hypothetical protein